MRLNIFFEHNSHVIPSHALHSFNMEVGMAWHWHICCIIVVQASQGEFEVYSIMEDLLLK